MIKRLKRGLVLLQELAGLHDVKFFFFSGSNGAGKDLQGALCEELLLPHGMYAHVGTSDAIRHHKNEKNELGDKLRLASENETRGILFPDGPTIGAIAEDVRELFGRGFKKFIVTGFPRGPVQPYLAVSINQSKIIDYRINLETSLARAVERTNSRKLRGEAARDDDKPDVVRDRFKDDEKTTPQKLVMIHRVMPRRVIFIDSEQPVGTVLGQTLRALDQQEDVVMDCLHRFDKRSTERIRELMACIDGTKRPSSPSSGNTSPKVEGNHKMPVISTVRPETDGGKWAQPMPTFRRVFTSPVRA